MHHFLKLCIVYYLYAFYVEGSVEIAILNDFIAFFVSVAIRCLLIGLSHKNDTFCFKMVVDPRIQ